jgi:hypothetical protein
LLLKPVERWERFQPSELNPRWRLELQRILVALGGAGILCLIIWLLRARSLGRPTNIVSWPTFVDYNYTSAILRYRLEADAFPVLAILIYLLIARWGPRRLRAGRDVLEQPPVAETANPKAVKSLSVSGPSRSLSAALVRTLPAGLFLGWCLRPGLGGLPINRGLLWFLLTIGYIAVVCCSAWLLNQRAAGHRDWSLVEWISAANVFACPVAGFAGVWWLSHTAAVRLADGSSRYWPWIPIWFGVLAILAVWAWTVLQLRRGRSPLWLESRVRVVLLGALTMYVLTAGLAHPISYLQGFDDSQGMTFTKLVQEGYFPWRDFIMSHGPLDDLLQPLLGFGLFQDSVWGGDMGGSVVFLPLCWVCIYWFGVWIARPGSAFVLVPLAWAASGYSPLEARFLFVPLTLIMLGVALARPTRLRLVALTTALFLNALATPESGFVVIGSVIALITADLAGGPSSSRVTVRFSRTVTFVVTGVLLLAAWIVFLAAEGALSGFIRYFQFFLSQHTAQSFILPTISNLQRSMFTAMELCAVTAILVIAWRVRQRFRFTPLAGVALASAVAAGLYGEQAIGRMDPVHYDYSLQMALPLFTISVWWLLNWLDARVDLGIAKRVRANLNRLLTIRSAVTVAAVAVFSLATSAVVSSFASAPGHTVLTAPRSTIIGPLGYQRATAMPNHELSDWRKIIQTYSRPGAPFLDMTNATGYFYYLMGLKPASVFTSLGTALNPAADQLLRDNVKRSRPPLVAFNADLTGMNVWDGVSDNVRNYLTSQYVLSHWTPIVKSHGVLFLLRNDLLRHRVTAPRLARAPLTRGLYDSVPTCAWGDSPNFLQSVPAGPSLTLRGHVGPRQSVVTVTGWAFDQATSAPAREIVVTVGGHVEAVVPVNMPRGDVSRALRSANAIYSGFDVTYLTTDGRPPSVYALTSDGKLHLLAPTGSPGLRAITLPGGRTVSVGSSAAVPGPKSFADHSVAVGYVDWASPAAAQVTSFKIPAGVSVGSYPLATFRADSQLGQNTYTVLDRPTDATDATITMSSLPLTGSSLPVRVGTCLQWHGYHSRTLYLAASGGAPVTSLQLSGVR